MKKLLPLSIISLAALVATPVLAGPGHRGEKVVDARDLRGDINEAEQSLRNLRNSLRRICRRDCRGVRSELNKLEATLNGMDRKLKRARSARAAAPPVHHGPVAMSGRDLSHLRRRLINDQFDSHRQRRIERELPVLTVRMVVAVLDTFSFDSSRQTALLAMNPYIVDPENYALIDGAFRHRAHRDRARAVIAARARGHHNRGAIAQAPRGSNGRGRRAP